MPYSIRVKINSKWFSVNIDSIETDPVIAYIDGEKFEVSLDNIELNKNDKNTSSYSVTEKQEFFSPLPGVIVSILVSEGDEVRSGTELCVIETMKIQQTLRSSYDGIVTQINVKESDQIKTGESLLEICSHSALNAACLPIPPPRQILYPK